MNGTLSAGIRSALLAAGLVLTTVAQAATGHHLATHGIRMYYEVHGQGPALLMLHGGTGNGSQFEHQLPAFSPGHRCIVPDCCAQGRTTDRPEPLTYHAMAEDMIALLDRLHVKRADIIGWSDGGNIGLDIAMHHPERVGHLVTFGANFRPDGLERESADWVRTATAANFGAGMRRSWQAMNPQPAHYDEAIDKVIAMWRTQPQWTEADLGRIRAKVLVVAGDHDMIRVDHTQALARAIPGAECWIVPGARHSVMVDLPELVNPRIAEFLAK